MTTFNDQYLQLSNIDKYKVFNYKNTIIKWVDAMKSGETMDYSANAERRLIYFAVVDVFNLRIFGECLIYNGYSITLNGLHPGTKGKQIRNYYDRNR